MGQTTNALPIIYADARDEIGADGAQLFRDNGVLVVRGVLGTREVRALQDATQPLIDRAARERVHDEDYMYGDFDGRTVPRRIEYVIDKLQPCKVLLGHPFVLRSVERLQGRNFVPTWDSVVFKLPGAGVQVPWHDDGATMRSIGAPIFNVDFYLDEADLHTCVWAIPGSNLWSAEEFAAKIAEMNCGGFKTEGAVPVPMQAGDVLFHDVRVAHGSPPSHSKLRRVLYYEFRPAEIEAGYGPHVPSYIPVKQRVLLACLRHRAQAPYTKGERPYEYKPSPEFPPAPGDPPTYRYSHQQWWRH